MLTISEFKEREAACRATRPAIFRLAAPDPPASDQQIAAVEAAIKCRLPKSYKAFLRVAGGGDYPLFSVFSANPGSEYYLPQQVAKLKSLVEDGLLPIHDDQAGGLYVLKIVAGEVLEEVHYWDWETRELSKKAYDSVLDLVVDKAFS